MVDSTTSGDAATEEYLAIVQDVLTGPHGRFVITRVQGVIGSITFALVDSVWAETEPPERGAMVVLRDLRKKKAGWRAHSARFMRPSDQQPIPVLQHHSS